MTSSMETDVKLPHKSLVRKLFIRNLVILIPLVVSLYCFVNTGSFLDPLSSPLTSCKFFSLILTALETFSWFLVVQSSKRQIWNLMKSVVLIFFSSIMFYCLAVLYGAPLISSSAETYHFAMLLSVTAVLPSCCVFGPNSTPWIKVYLLNLRDLGVESVVFITTLCALIGGWLGAFPIPLDWDRPWQVWPISCVVGNLVGYCVGLVLSLSHLLYHTRQRKCKLF